MKLKVCGITSVSQLLALSEMDIDFAGLIFVKSSPRYAYEKLISRKAGVKNSSINKVGVFVNEKLDTVKRMIDEFGLDYVQLHGDEDVDYTSKLNQLVPVIKAFRVSGNESIEHVIKSFEEACSFYMFDSLSDDGSYGGTGKSFNWEILGYSNIGRPFFLSGGISRSHADVLKGFSHPSLFAVDVNSKFEMEPGVKDLEKVQLFKTKLDQKTQQ